MDTEPEATASGLFHPQSERATSSQSHLSKSERSGVSQLSMLDGIPSEEFESFEDRAFDRLEPIYQDVIERTSKAAASGVNQDQLKDHFMTLWMAIQASQKNEVDLIRAERNITKELSDTMAKTRYLIKVAEDDPGVAKRLAEKLDKAWKLTEVGEEAEKKTMERIVELKEDISGLNRDIEEASKIEGAELIQELSKMKRELEDEREEVNQEAEGYRSQLNVIYEKRQRIFLQKQASLERMKMLEHEMRLQKESEDRELKRKTRLEDATDEIVGSIANKERELEEMERKTEESSSKFIELESSLREQQIINESNLREGEMARNRIEKLRSDFENKLSELDKLASELQRRHQELRARELEVGVLKKDLVIANRESSTNLKRVVTSRAELTCLERERERLKRSINLLEADIETEQKRISQHKRQLDTLDKERFVLSKNFHRATNVLDEQTDLSKTHETALRNINKDLKNYQDEMEKQREMIVRLEKERDFYSHEGTKLANHVSLRLDEIKKLDIMIYEYRKRLAGMESQLKKQQQIADNALFEKRMYEKQLRESLKVIMDNATKIRHTHHRAYAVKFTIGECESELSKNSDEYEKLLKETEFFKREGERMRKMALDLERQTEALDLEKSTLCCGVAELESEVEKQRFYAKSAESRARAYERKLMDKERELREAWGCWRNVHSEMRIAFYHIRKLAESNRDLRCDIMDVTKNKIKNAFEIGINPKSLRILNGEASYLENLIAKEQGKINTLEDQLSHPINVHRWRLLDAADPDAFKVREKLTMLTKRLVLTNNGLKRKNDEIDQKQTLYLEIKEVLMRSPGLETPEEVKYLAQLLSAKHKQLTNLRSDYESANSQAEYYKREIEMIRERMGTLKKAYMEKVTAKKERDCQRGQGEGDFQRYGLPEETANASMDQSPPIIDIRCAPGDQFGSNSSENNGELISPRGITQGFELQNSCGDSPSSDIN